MLGMQYCTIPNGLSSPSVQVRIRESALVHHSADRMFDLIEAAEDYPLFLPWCADAKILSRDQSLVVATITVSYHGVRFNFTTRNAKRRPEWMAVLLDSGPFRRFAGEWQLTPLTASACKIQFTLDYEFKVAFLNLLARSVFDGIANTLVDAFVMRAQRLFGVNPPVDAATAGARSAASSGSPQANALDEGTGHRRNN